MCVTHTHTHTRTAGTPYHNVMSYSASTQHGVTQHMICIWFTGHAIDIFVCVCACVRACVCPHFSKDPEQ